MEKRVVIAVVLSIAVLYAYSFIFPQPAQQKVAEKPVATQQTQTVTAPATAPAPVPSPATPQGNIAARDVVVDTDLYTAVFSTRGAGLKKLLLKKYKDQAGTGGKDIVLKNDESPDRFSLLTEGKNFALDPSLHYECSATELKLTGTAQGQLEFRTTTSAGITLKKIYSFSAGDYAVALHQDVANMSGAKVEGPLHLVNNNRIETNQSEGRYEVYGPVSLADSKLVTEKITDFNKGPKSLDNNIAWTAFGDKYFINAVISQNSSVATVRFAKAGDNYLQSDISSPSLSLNPGQSAAVKYTVFYGPKDLDILKAQGSRLEEAIDFGWFSALAKPLLRTLKFFYTYTHNYGIAIIIITIILKVIFFPLTHKSYKSMKEMQKLQPKMAELKEKFKNDRDAMNRAVMELYKTHKVNPMGGCLPMLVQIPVFFALYKALMFSIELRHAPFMLWITDLSAKDPYYVTPIIMGVTMFIQQKMTPTNMDPIQAKMMLALPVVFTFMFLSFPSGLVLYWLINNILTIAQQAYINKSLPE